MFEELPGAEPFLAAIREAPEDSTHRLVFADWLEEQDDPRAGWLRDPDIWPWMSPTVTDPVPALLAELLSEDWERRHQISEVLRKLGTPAVDAVRTWTRVEPVRRWWETRWMLEQARPPQLRSVPDLIEALSSPSWYECWQAVIDLGFHGPDAAPAVSALVQVDRYDDEYGGGDHDPLEEAIIAVLGGLGPAAAAAVPYLYGRLEGRANVREAAQDALHTIGPHVPEAMLAHVPRVNDDMSPEMGLSILVDTHPEKYAVLARVLRGEVSLYDAASLVSSILSGGEYGEPPELDPAEAEALVPPLLDILQRPPSSGYDYSQASAAQSLGLLGEPARAAVPILRTMLAELDQESKTGHQQTHLRETIASALTRLGDTEAGLGALVEGLSAQDQHTRAAHVRLLAEMAVATSEALPHVVGALRDRAAGVREEAAQAIFQLVSNDSDPNLLVSPLLTATTDSSAEVRRNAVAALGSLKKKHVVLPRQNPPIITALSTALDDSTERVRIAAVEALTHWNDLPASVVDPLLRLAQSSSEDYYRAQALGVLRKVKELPDSLTAPMIALFTDRGDDVAGAAADLLTKIGAPAVPALIETLQHGGKAVVGHAIRALHDMGDKASAAAPDLARFADGREPQRQAFVLEILGQMKVPDISVPLFRKGLASRNRDVRYKAAVAIYHTGNAAAAALPELLTCARDEDDSVRHMVLSALRKMDADPDTLIPIFQDALKDGYSSNREEAVKHLGNIGQGRPELFPEVIPLCEDSDKYVRRAAIHAVAALAPSPIDALPLVLHLLDDPEGYVQSAAREELARIVPEAALADPVRFVQIVSQESLEKKEFSDAMQALSKAQWASLIPLWRQLLGSEELEDRQSAARLLRILGPDGEEALREAEQDNNPVVQEAARYGLEGAPPREKQSKKRGNS